MPDLNELKRLDGTVPWIVFSDTAPVYASMEIDSKKLNQKTRGDEVTAQLKIGPEKDIEWLELDGGRGFLLRASCLRIYPGNHVSGNIPVGEEFVNRWWGLPLEYEPDDLVEVDSKFRYEKDRVYRLRKEAASSLVELLEAAKSGGLDIRICSDYRSGLRQREIYLAAIDKDGPEQRYSAPPGHSEHQLGTTADLVDAEGKHLFSQEMDQHPEGKWLEENAPRFGFSRSYYPHNESETGYISEPWHWRFIGR